MCPEGLEQGTANAGAAQPLLRSPLGLSRFRSDGTEADLYRRGPPLPGCPLRHAARSGPAGRFGWTGRMPPG